jgi:signal transduction histidine kinase
VSKLRDEDGFEGGMLAVIRDITERKNAEALLLNAHHKLEERVVERTRKLASTNEALQSEIRGREAVERQRTELLQRIVRTQEDERRRIARDIHDQLGQRVTALRLQIATLADRSTDPSKHEGQLEILRRTAMRLDSEIGFLAWELRPMSLDDLGLLEAAKAFVEEWSHNYKITSDFILRGVIRERLDPEVETHLYRILQESLNNVAKHSAATSVNVLLHWKKNEVALIIEDNGRGFDPEKTMSSKNSSKGLGLLGMYERAVLIDGTVEIESARGKGTTIYTRVPIAGKTVKGNKKKRAA